MNMINFLSFVSDLDQGFAKLTNDFFNQGGDILAPFLKFYTYLGNGGMAFIIAALIMLFFKKTRLIGVMGLISLLFGALITNIALKNIVARPRPFLDQSSPYYNWWVAAGSLPQGGYSFPSGHATASMALCFVMFLKLDKKYSWSFLIIALLMGYTRIYFMVHFLSDVLIGLLVGILTSLCAYFIIYQLQKFNFMKKFENLPSITQLFKKR